MLRLCIFIKSLQEIERSSQYDYFCLNYVPSVYVCKNRKTVVHNSVYTCISFLTFYLALSSEKNALACISLFTKSPNYIHFLFRAQTEFRLRTFSLRIPPWMRNVVGNSVMFVDISVSYRVSPEPGKARWWNKPRRSMIVGAYLVLSFVRLLCLLRVFCIAIYGHHYSWHGSNYSLCLVSCGMCALV